ncbi:S1/P1 Nuclease [Rubripirellula tenax]|uniref:S1/P1 Nuclease n=2 Tax=Rubripirellula tenax TaxID=2528015 RepID=A0A5C6F8F5_9BACT|nr:S1/P1 Nuclease [Rubripirellula tenax]
MVGVIAYDLMNAETRSEVMRILRHHPQFNKHFLPPKNVHDPESIHRWQIGIAGCWPDFIRDSNEDRPKWHYELGASYVIGNVRPPNPVGPPPRGATMKEEDLYLSQAIEVCTQTLGDASKSDEERAVALCWVLHLYADGHQPCHAGSLYAPAFPKGDRGGNQIELADGSNLHTAWDNLLGSYPSANEVRSRVAALGDIRSDMMKLYLRGGKDRWILPKTWIEESLVVAKSYVYSDEVTGPIIAASRGLTPRIPPLKLSTDYYRVAGEVARYRIKQAGFRAGVAVVRCVEKPSRRP